MSFDPHPADHASAPDDFGKSNGLRASLLGGTAPGLRQSLGFRGREGYMNVIEDYPPAPAASSRPSKFYLPNTTWTWSFAIVTFTQTLVTLALEMCVCSRHSSDSPRASVLITRIATSSSTSRPKKRRTQVPPLEPSPPSWPCTASVSSTSWSWFTMLCG